METIYQVASNLTHPISLAAFAIAIILGILTIKRRVPPIVWVAIILLVLVPIAISAYVELQKEKTIQEGIYRVRVTVTEPEGIPTDDAQVWSSLGGEAKKVAAGWQFDIPKATRPANGKLIIFAARPTKFLKGEQQLELTNEFNPSVVIALRSQDSVSVRGQVIDNRNRAVSGARVNVAGYENEAVITGLGGNFVLPAHAAKDQEVLLHAERKGYAAKTQWHPAGDFPAVITLERK